MFILLFWWGLQIVPAINKGSKSFWRDYRGTRINSRRTTECLFCLALQFWICARSIAGGPPAFPKTIFPHIWPYRPTCAIGFWGYVGLAPQACLRRVWWLWYCWVELSDIVMRACEPSFPALFSVFIMTNEKIFFHGQRKKLIAHRRVYSLNEQSKKYIAFITPKKQKNNTALSCDFMDFYNSVQTWYGVGSEDGVLCIFLHDIFRNTFQMFDVHLMSNAIQRY